MDEKKQGGIGTMIEIPEGVEIKIENSLVTAKGSQGEFSRKLIHPLVNIEMKDDKIMLSSKQATKREKKIIGTFSAHIKNMMKGVQERHVYKLKICSGHFPMNVSASKEEIVIKNFLGEKVPRSMKIRDDVELKIDGNLITIESVNKEAAGQVAAKIELLTKVKNRDRRIFQDGVYIIEKDGKIIG